MNIARSEFFAGIRAELPILAGVIPFGLIYGVAAVKSGLPAALAQAMSFIVFAGSAQFVMAQILTTAIPAAIIILTIFIINLRHALYSASIAPYLKNLSGFWKWLVAYLLTDEAFLVSITHFHQPGDTGKRQWYFLGAGLALWTTWQTSTAAGVFLGGQIPASWSLDFALPLTFIALVVPAIKDRASIGAALVAGAVAIIAFSLPNKAGLLTATLLGIATGIAVESLSRRTAKERQA